MTTKLMVLGIIYRQNFALGYTVLHELKLWKAETWTKIQPGSVYHALTKLHRDGFIQKVDSSATSKKSANTQYRLTSSGKAELVQLVEEALMTYDQEQFTAGLAFMEVITRVRAVELAQKRLKMYRETVAFMKTLPRTKKPATPAEHAGIINSWSIIFESTLRWQKQFLQDLQSGEYKFKDDVSTDIV